MPRQKLARRFEPRYGVSQSMLDTESKWVQRELDDHLIYSIEELKKRLSDVQTKVASSEMTLRETINRLPDRERLAVKSMLARDIYHIAALYGTFLRCSPDIERATRLSTSAAEEIDRDDEPRPVLIFKGSLFG